MANANLVTNSKTPGRDDRRRVERRRGDRRHDERRSESAVARARRPVEQRRYPRFAKSFSVALSRKDPRHAANVVFTANVASRDLSVSGIFLESTYFLRPGTSIDLAVDIAPLERVLHFTGEVARVADDARRGATGFAVRFTHYRDDAEVLLRAFLTRGDMLAFVNRHAAEVFSHPTPESRTKLVEFLVRWQMQGEKVES